MGKGFNGTAALAFASDAATGEADSIKSTGGAQHVRLDSLLAGEDQTLDAILVADAGNAYKAVAASQTDSLLGAVGAAGDYLKSLIVTVNTSGATATLSIKDGSTSIPIGPSGGFGSTGVFEIRLGLKSLNGAWKVTTGAGLTVLATGKFTS